MATSNVNTPSSKSGKDQLQDALKTFTSSLSTIERQNLPANPDLKDIVDFISNANKLNSKRRPRKYGERIQPFLKALHQFTGTVDVMVQSNPQITSLVWGSVKFFMTVALAHNNYFEEVSKILERIGKLCPLIENFSALLPDPDFQDAVCEFYSIILDLFTTVIGILRKGGWRSYFKAVIGSLKGDVQEFEAKLERHRGYVDGYIKLASERAHHRERQQHAHFRSQVIDYTVSDISRWNASSDWRIHQDLRYIKMKRNILLEKITGHNYHDMYFRHLSKLKQGTGDWIFNLNGFNNWETEPSAKPLLWCHGIPGSGKSVLTATITKYLLKRYPKSTAFFFCDFQQKSSLQWETIVRSLVRQLLATSDQYNNILEKFDQPMSQDEVVETLQDLLRQTTGPCYLVLDGIDECEETDRYKLLWLLEELFRLNPGKTKILVACRYSVDISRRMAEDRVHETNLAQHVGPDIEKYIEAELQERIRFRRLAVTSEMCREIEEALATKADGMFLYVQFQLDDICTAITENAVRDCLRGLPRGLSETYDRILVKIEKFQDFRLAKKVFNWLVAASTPLTVEQLAEACAFEPGDKQYSDGRFAIDDWKLIFNCGNLITVERQDEKDLVHFAHSTILDHLRKKDVVDDTTANQDAASICLTYLSFSDFERQLILHTSNKPVQIQNPKEWIPSLISSSQNVSATAKVVHAVSKINDFTKPKDSKINLPPIDLTALQIKLTNPRDTELEALRGKYQFFEYAHQNWIEHCRFISSDHPSWGIFAILVSEKTLPINHLPWVGDIPGVGVGQHNRKYTEGRRSRISTAEFAPVEWAIRCQHFPLLKILHSLIDTEKWYYILSSRVLNGEIVSAWSRTQPSQSGAFSAPKELDFFDWRVFFQEQKSLITSSTNNVATNCTLLAQAMACKFEIRKFLFLACPAWKVPLAISLATSQSRNVAEADSEELYFPWDDIDRYIPMFGWQGNEFKYGNYLLDALGLVIVVASDWKRRGTGSFTSKSLERLLWVFTVGQPGAIIGPAYRYHPDTPDKDIQKKFPPSYREWALELKLPDVADALKSLEVNRNIHYKHGQPLAPIPECL